MADPASLAVRPDLPIKRIVYDEANISAARNLGIGAAAGEVVAFIDDDAIAEPTWAARLAGVFAEPAVIAATGWTRGPWGRSWQYRGEAITPGGPAPLPAPVGAGTRLYRPAAGITLGPLGTNCAFRRDALVAVGGLDRAFAYHLDESDLALRLAYRFPDADFALVPGAEVTHGTAPSERRGHSGVPHDLTRIGQSEAIFAARHGGDAALIEPRLRRSLIAHMLAGRLLPWDVERLLVTLRRGMAVAVPPAPPSHPLSPPHSAFAALTAGPRSHRVIAGRWSARRRLRAEAEAAVRAGGIVTLILLIPGLLPHRTRFTPGGWWEQIGGGWGPSQPDDPPVLPLSRRRRIAREAAVLTNVRHPVQDAPLA